MPLGKTLQREATNTNYACGGHDGSWLSPLSSASAPVEILCKYVLGGGARETDMHMLRRGECAASPAVQRYAPHKCKKISSGA